MSSMGGVAKLYKKCYLCGGVATDRHHMLNGLAYRSKAEKYGLVVNLCRACHNEVHFGKRSRELSDMLRKEAQRRFRRNYPELDFKEVFGINYLDEDDEDDEDDETLNLEGENNE